MRKNYTNPGAAPVWGTVGLAVVALAPPVAIIAGVAALVGGLWWADRDWKNETSKDKDTKP